MVRSQRLLFIIGGQADFLCLMSTRFKVGTVEACVSRQAGAFSTVEESDWTNWCKGSPARLQMRREALCASGIRIPHQVAAAAAAIRQVNDQSFTVSPSTFVSSPHPLHRALGGDVTGCESWSQEIRVSEECTNIITAPIINRRLGTLNREQARPLLPPMKGKVAECLGRETALCHFDSRTMPVLALIPVAASLVRVRLERKGLAGGFQPRRQTLQSRVEAVEILLEKQEFFLTA